MPNGFAPSKAQAKGIAHTTWVCLLVNISLTIFKILVGVMASSTALVADGIHSLSDLATDLAILVGVRYWSAPPDQDHPYGHQKIESLVTLFIGLVLAATGLGLAVEAILYLRDYLGAASPPTLVINSGVWLALTVALMAVVSKEILYRWTTARGRALSSPVLLANALHQRSDALSSLAPTLALGGLLLGDHFGCHWWYLDPIATLVVCLLILKAAWDVIKSAGIPLVDTALNRDYHEAISEIALKTPGVLDAHKIRTRYLGGGQVAVDLHILVDAAISVAEGHDLAAAVKYKIIDFQTEEGLEIQIVDVIVHVEPFEAL